MIDATSVRVHQHVACAPKKMADPVAAALVRLKISEGQGHDGRAAANMPGSVGACQILMSDRAYDSDALRTRMAEGPPDFGLAGR